MDPVYPVYVDTNVMAGHTGPCDPSGAYPGLVYLPCTAANGFVPELPAKPVDLVYLCYPNNPTGATATRTQLAAWVDYALKHRTLILYDAAYEAFIADPSLPRSIFEIPGARDCAIEFRSFSKTGGFTGTRCAFTVVPRTVMAEGPDGRQSPLHPLWLRRMTTKFNGVSYLVQRAAEALYTAEGREQVRHLISFYLGNARLLRDAAAQLGLEVHGGTNAPYLWVGLPAGLTSWQAFDRLLLEANLVVTPGSGFGRMGEGYVRISAFNSRANVEEAALRLKQVAW
jgi:LL-diaminopimelate aminotransferase